jgi:hypothetical protein
LTLDALARRVIAASLLYYGADFSIMKDEEYDAGCRLLSAGWGDLSSFRQWQLGSPDEILSTGYHVKATQWSHAGACDWYRKVNRHSIKLWSTSEWRWDEDRLVHWLPVTEFRNEGMLIPGVDQDAEYPSPPVVPARAVRDADLSEFF